MNGAFSYLLAYTVLSLMYRLLRLKSALSSASKQPEGKKSARPIFWIMTLTYLFYFALCTVAGLLSYASLSWGISLIGLALYVLALALREKAMKDLGQFFSPNIEIRATHTVICQGLYRWVRHPLLLCMAIEIVGVGLVFNAYKTLLFFGVGIYFPLLGIRKILEEKMLLRQLGDTYRQYQEDVGAFWPAWKTVKEHAHG